MVTDQVHLHRRDYNLVPQIFPNGEEGYTVSSGVFQIGADLPFLYPVDIKSSGHTPQTAFNQYLSNYHSATAALYDSTSNTMHSLFFGGMSQYAFVNNVLTQNNTVPFVKTISRVSRDSNGNLQEHLLPVEMPALVGASAEFIPNHLLPYTKSEILKISQVTGDSVLAGHIYGGIYSPVTSPFTSNQSNVTNAHSTIYEVWLVKSTVTGLKAVDGRNPLRMSVYPNPANLDMALGLELPYAGDGELYVTDMSGKIVHDRYFKNLNAGKNNIYLSDRLRLRPGVYSFNFVFNGIYNGVEKVVITE